MWFTNLSKIDCHLTDKHGNILNPYNPMAISYSDVTRFLKTRSKRIRLPSGKYVRANQFVVYIQGYISLFVEDNRIPNPIPFRIYKSFYLCVPKRTDLSFKTCYFNCGTKVISNENDLLNLSIKINIGSMAQPKTQPKTFCQRYFTTEINITYRESLLRTEVYQYNTLYEEDKKEYTNEDEIPEYGNRGILDPEMVSFFNLYINGVVQPRENYDIEQGKLTLNIVDAPVENAPILIRFVTFRDSSGDIYPAEIYYYNTISDGIKNEYIDEDKIGDTGIIDPEEVSFVNLYVNGVLQPEVNYTVQKGLLSFQTSDIPPKDVPITLEFIKIRRPNGQLVKAKTYTFNALAHESNIYTNQDELIIYGDQGILDPKYTSYNNLFINAVLQPFVNYSVEKGLLTLNTDDLPLKDSPVSLQFISITSLY
ncbi:MAG TPA: DUF4183 domain-containing protein [Epulopiscium sp.]|nr:DUF4183 domain-containing protein [Candidatus Epulonipiscium sp.]